MKTFFLSIIATLGFMTFSLSQATGIAKAQSKKELAASKLSGSYVFTLPSGISEDDVTKNASYYVHYFTVSYSQKSAQVKIDMIENDDKSRHIIIRFLTSIGMKAVTVEQKNLELNEFFTSYLQ
jgi:hypothetical protein